MKYVALKFFNEYRPGDEVKDPNPLWLESSLIYVDEATAQKDNEVASAVELLDPEKKVNKKK